MKKIFTYAIVCIFAFSVFSAFAQSEKLTNTDISTFKKYSDNASKVSFNSKALMDLKRLSDPQLSPDGEWLLFNISTPNVEENKFQRDIYKVSVSTKRLVQLTEDPKTDVEARWSPDGKKIAFTSNREGSMQIYTMNPDGSNVKKITNIENGVSNIAWSPDGKSFSFTSDVKIKESVFDKYPQYGKANIRIYNNLPARHWDEWNDEYYSHLFIISANGGAAIDLMKDEPFDTPLKPFGGGEQIAWSPDSKEIAYTCKKISNIDFARSTNSDVYVYNIAAKSVRNISDGMPGYDLEPLYSPDGKWLAFISMEHASFESDRRRLMLLDRSTGKIKEISHKIDQWVGEKIWANDSKSVYFTAEDSGSVQIHNLRIEDGSWNYITEGWYNHDGGICLSKDGSYLVYGRESITESNEYFKMNLKTKEITRLTSINDNELAKYKKINIARRWVNTKDGKKVFCWVVYPPDFSPEKKYPMISYLQGGPQSMLGQKFHFRWNYYLMASHGYIVLLPNRRGVPGFGQEWNNAISGDWGGAPMDDILAATDDMSNETYVDEHGRCAVGASAGGYAAFWLAGHHNKRFSAFIAHCGVFDLESMYGATEELWFPNWEYGGPYWEGNNKAFYDKHSPNRYIQNWDTPIMISTGEQDFRVPYTQSLEAFTAAQYKGIPSKLISFPNETHFISKPQEFIIWNSEFFEFLDTYCKRK